MEETGSPPAVERHVTCRNLLWEASSDSGEKVPGRYCVNRLGVVHFLDCPVYQGIDCCLFDPRPEGEEAEPATEAGVEDARARLSEDYLRWSYWRTVGMLRAPEPPAETRRKVTADVEEEEGEAELADVVREQTKPPDETAPVEKYPGQHRSEDRHRAREPSLPGPPLEELLADEDVEEPAEPEGPPSEKTEPATAQDEKAAPAEKRKSRRRRRRGRRRGRRREPPDQSGSR